MTLQIGDLSNHGVLNTEYKWIRIGGHPQEIEQTLRRYVSIISGAWMSNSTKKSLLVLGDLL